jgi:hypothetical protein
MPKRLDISDEERVLLEAIHDHAEGKGSAMMPRWR